MIVPSHILYQKLGIMVKYILPLSIHSMKSFSNQTQVSIASIILELITFCTQVWNFVYVLFFWNYPFHISMLVLPLVSLPIG
jgi:hypothetical protein